MFIKLSMSPELTHLTCIVRRAIVVQSTHDESRENCMVTTLELKKIEEPVRKVQRGISLDPDDDRIAQELAAKSHGDNISRLIRHLLRDAWDRETKSVAA